MHKVLKNYSFTILMLAGVLAGGVCGILLGGKVTVVKPVGDLFLNLLFTLVVPLVFFSTASSVSRLTRGRSVGRVLGAMVLVFVGMSVVASLLGVIAVHAVNPLKGVDHASLLSEILQVPSDREGSIGDAIVSTVTVPEFTQLFHKSHLLALIIFSALFGAGTALSGEKGLRVAEMLDSGTAVIMKMLGIVMYIAPLGLGCYFACLVSDVGARLIGGYARVFLIDLSIAIVIYFILNPLYVLLARGWPGVKAFWRHILPPTLTAMATASSAATIPGNIEAAKKMGVSDEIADSAIALGTNLHKDGSVFAAVVKVYFALILTGQSIAGAGVAAQAIGISLLVAVAVGAIASGGMTGELLICTLLGLDPRMAGMLIIIGTLVDVPCTVINTTSNTSAAVVIDTLVSRRRKE